ncbi:hypothetical protein [Streptomyces sp. NPDC057695]|uniref:hypothetical protein n=1 Tax=Streptomyces sp. NPDC057695 TaxID=3346217 RepID=UPI0036942856
MNRLRLTTRPAKTPHRRHVLEPGRHAVQQRTRPTLAYSIHVRQLYVRLGTLRPDRYRHQHLQRFTSYD